MKKQNAVRVVDQFFDVDQFYCPTEHFLCPNCGRELSHFSGTEGIPEYQFCGDCNDAAYGLDGGFMAWLE